MGVKGKILISAIILSFLYGGYYWGIPAAVNLPARMPSIENKIKQDLGYDISVKNPALKMGIIPSVYFKADSIKLINSDGSEALGIDAPALHIKLLPFVFNRVVVDNVSANSLMLNTSLGKDGKFRIGNYVIPEVEQKDINLNITGVNVNSYSVSFKDLAREKTFQYNGVNFNLAEFSNHRIKFSTKSTLTIGKKSSKIDVNINSKLPLNKIDENHLSINADVENLDLSDFSVYARYFTNNEIQNLQGIINIHAATSETKDGHKNIISNLKTENLAIEKADKFASIYSPNPLNITSNISTINNGLRINDMQIKSKNIDVAVKGDIKKLTSKTPDISDMIIDIKKSRTEAFIPLMPGEENLVPEVDLYTLKKHPFYGNIEGQLKLNGNAITPDVYGSISVSDGYLEHPIKTAPKGADIKLDFNKDKMMLDVLVPTTKIEKVFVTGDIGLYGEKLADLSIKSTQNVDLKTAQVVLNPLHRILKFLIGPVPVMDIKGIGNIDLRVTGNKKKPHAFGQFNFRNATVSFLDIHNMEVKNGAGFLKFNDVDTYFENTSGILNGEGIKITGTCNLYGELDFKADTKNQDLGALLNIIKTSPMLKDIQPMIAPIKTANGPVNFHLNLTGKVPDVNEMVFNKNIFAKGYIELLSANIVPAGMSKPLTKISGLLNFDNTNVDMKLSSFINHSKIDVNGKLDDKKADLKIHSEKFRAGDAFVLLDDFIKLPFRDDFSTIYTKFDANYLGPVDKIDLDKVNLNGKIYSNKGAKSIVIVSDGNYSVKNGSIRVSPLSGTFNMVPYRLHFSLDNAFNKNPKVNGNFYMKGFNFSTLSELKDEDIIPDNIKKELSNITNITGTVDVTANAKNNSIRMYTNPHDVSFIYQPARMHIKLNSGNLSLNGATLYLNKINSYVGEMPVLIDGKVSNIFKKPNMDLYINAKPTQEFFDQFFNNRTLYPLKLKGDMLFSAKINGFIDNIHSKINMEVAEDSSLYYMGATLGGTDRVVKIYLDSILTPLRFKINDFKYSNLIKSQNNKSFEMEMLKASGAVKMIDENTVVFENMKIKTENPTDAKIFNILFRKPFMKQGLFSTDLTLNGNIKAPKVRGFVDVTSIDVPFYDSTINDIHLDFTASDILFRSRGVVLTNDIMFFARMKNDLTPPYILKNVKLELADLNVNQILKMIRDLELDYQRNSQVGKAALASNTAESIDMSQFRIQDAKIIADTIRVKNINAEDFAASLTLDENMLLDVDKFKFKLANGNVHGNMQYNLLSNLLNLSLNLQDADALIMSEALFDLKGQVYGNMTGNINLSCDGKSQETCTQTLSGDGRFAIKEGKMPKLGSLEYLLKAGNLLTGGITGLSINGIIDLITPLKTGNFDDIYGNILFNNGIIHDINIYSSSRDLNMYLTGNYNIMSAVASMKIYGNLSRNMSTVFGKIKNASLNTLLNTIPFMNKTEIDDEMRQELEKIPNTKVGSNESRIFAVEVEGDINGTAYVKSFKWVK